MRVRRQKGDRGAAAVEFAVVLPVFMMLVMGTIDFGYYFYVSEVVTNAAREGARAGSVQAPTENVTTVEDRAEAAANDYLTRGGLSQKVAVATVVPLGVSGVPAVEVVVRYPVGSVTGFLPMKWLEAANATAVMRWQ